jgi:alpha-L-arabinofuranosidase
MKSQHKNEEKKHGFNQIRLRSKKVNKVDDKVIQLELCGEKLPEKATVDGMIGMRFFGDHGCSSYAMLPKAVELAFDDRTGFTMSSWVYFEKSQSIWERLFDFGVNEAGPYVFLTRRTRGVCLSNEPLAIDYFGSLPEREWVHIAMSVAGTNEGKSTYAGPKIFINGVCVANGAVSQTSSGRYKAIQEFFQAMSREKEMKCYIGHSQFSVDPDFSGVMSQITVADFVMSEEEIVQDMCSGMSDEALIEMAYKKYLNAPKSIVESDLLLPTQLMFGEVEVKWESSCEEVLSSQGRIGKVLEPQGIQLKAILTCGGEARSKTFDITVRNHEHLTHRLVVSGQQEGIEISPDLYGLFYEDINNAADGGIYAELIQNRSFESFTYETYDARSGVHGKSTGRQHAPLAYWFGDIERVEPCYEGTLGEQFECSDSRANGVYVYMPKGTRLENRGFCDQRNLQSIPVSEGERYILSLWIKGEGRLLAYLVDETGEVVSNNLMIFSEGLGWKKQGSSSELVFVAKITGKVSFYLEALTNCSVDMVSLMPQNVWGTMEEDGKSARENHQRNSNYRLRRDLVESLRGMNPKFLRFPGGCISEGSYIWENVYEWKESIGSVELRIENYNVWGYMMTMGLGYYEYFQLAEDLHATPLPVMACGVLCQARSDYAHPAGGALRNKYISNFLDLIDFALSMDYENNPYAKLRNDLGHPTAFDLRYLGVGNENWGHEFYANFEVFKKAIDDHMMENYPGHILTIISTVGAQGDDDAYQKGWKFLSGHETERPTVVFSNGEEELIEQVSYYKTESNYMMTVADEHYYRSNDYLLNNTDRYHYYAPESNVFVGEYASTDKNTLAGALAEAAMMTHFEERSDCVKLAATAPLFNKVRGDGLYRWTPDCIWFDDDTVWHTPNYYVQSLFAQNIGKNTIPSTIAQLHKGQMTTIETYGGFEIPILEGSVLIRSIEVRDCLTRDVLFEERFEGSMNPNIEVFGDKIEIELTQSGLLISNKGGIPGGLRYFSNWKNYSCQVVLAKINGEDGLSIGVGCKKEYDGTLSSLRFVLDYYTGTTGLKVIKNDVEGYKLGDFSSSEVVGNMRDVYKHRLIKGAMYELTLIHDSFHKKLTCHMQHDAHVLDLEFRLLPFSHQLFTTSSQDTEYVYIKLVNPYPSDLKLAIELEGVDVYDEVDCVSLSGNESVVNKENVNQKHQELIRPIHRREQSESLKHWELSAYSVQILKLKKC